MSILSPFELDDRRLREVRDGMAAAIREGYTKSDGPIQALPSFLPPPPRGLAGSALVVDLGGTNMRAAVVELDGKGGAAFTRGPVSKRLEVRESPPKDAAAFFDLQAELAHGIGARPGLAVGYCFSLSVPSRSFTGRAAVALDQGHQLARRRRSDGRTRARAALSRRGLAPGKVTVLNDTVATLIGAAIEFRGPPERVIGLIVGTGNNMAVYARPEEAKKLKRLGWSGPMAINLESGAYHPPHLSALDDTLDRASTNPGAQRFEKAVSGRYLPELFRLACPDHPAGHSERGAGALVELRDRGPAGEPKEIARALTFRSADLVAASLAAAISLEPGDDAIGILPEGSTYWRDPAYPLRVAGTLMRLLVRERGIVFLQRDDANLIGAATAALL